MQNSSNAAILALRQKFINKGIVVSELEFTENNVDHNGKPIGYPVPTVTTEFCEIGFLKESAYFVFIIESTSFNKNLFLALSKYGNLTIYGFIRFNKTFYPGKSVNFESLSKQALGEKYLQLQFDFFQHSANVLFDEYLKILEVLKSNSVIFVNQLL